MLETPLATPPVSPTAPTVAPPCAGSLRVLVVTESFLPQINGVTNSVCRVLEHLQARGHTAAVVAPTGPDSYAGAPVQRVGGAMLPGYTGFTVGLATRRALRAAMSEFRPDVVHVASPFVLGYTALRAANDLGIPTVSIYQTDLLGYTHRYRLAPAQPLVGHRLRRIHRRTDLTLAPSSASLDQLAGLDIPRVRYWPRGIDTDRFNPQRRREDLRAELLGTGPRADPVHAQPSHRGMVGTGPSRTDSLGSDSAQTPPVRRAGAGHPEVLVGYVGRLAKEKDLDHLRGVATLSGVRLVLIGTGPEEPHLQAGLPQALFLGARQGAELAELVAALDVFVHPGREETFCQAVQEALASGIPAVGPSAGGLRDRIQHGVNGLLCTPGDPESLAAAVARIAGDPALRRSMGRAARAGVLANSWEVINDQLIGHYRSVIVGAPAALEVTTSPAGHSQDEGHQKPAAVAGVSSDVSHALAG